MSPNKPRSPASSIVSRRLSATSVSSAPQQLFLAREEDLESFFQAQSNQEKDIMEDSSEQLDLKDALGKVLGGDDMDKDKDRDISQPLTPLLQSGSPAPGFWSSAITGTPKSGSLGSLRLSDGESHHYDEEDEDEEDIQGRDFKRDSVDSVEPELVMPSLAMPDRRPFTERGRNMGRLRICVAGLKSAGKTSLVRAIVQQCEDIIHVDPLAIGATPNAFSRNGKASSKSKRILEIMASSKAYPSWWSDLEESRTLRRRKSFNDTVLERNICFVDPPGQNSTDQDNVVSYIEEQFWHTDSPEELTDAERLNLVSGKGGSLVDVVLYLFSDTTDLRPEIEEYNRLARLTNVVPLISKVDLLSEQDVKLLKRSILESLKDSPKPFLFGKSLPDSIEALCELVDRQGDEEEDVDTTQNTETSAQPDTTQSTGELPVKTHKSQIYPPFAISSLSGTDTAEMDASLLMSSQYTPPLVSSELPSLIHHLFEPENMAWLRYSAGRKFLAWRDRQLSLAIAELSSSDESMGISPVRRARLQRLAEEATRRPGNTSQSLILPRQSSNTPRLSGRTFSSESTKYEILPGILGTQSSSTPDRSRWLLEKLHEEVVQGTIGVLPSTVNDALSSPPSSSKRQLQYLTPDPSSDHPAHRKGNIPRKSSHWRRNTRNTQQSDLPAWARQRYAGKHDRSNNRIDHMDPLGICTAWEGWGRAIFWGAGGGIVVGVVWVVVARSWGFKGLGGVWE